MSNEDLLTRYNYDAFVPAKFEPWMRFDQSPALGSRTPDFQLLTLKGEETSLMKTLNQAPYTVVEFGSFT